MAFHGQGLDLAILILKNFVLSILTIGIYSFWGKTEVRKWLWSHTEFHNDRFAFHGTGGELLKGWLKVIGFFIAYNVLVQVALQVSIELLFVIQGIFALAMLFIVPFALYMQQRYLLSRTTWRSVRFGMTPEAGRYIKEFVLGFLLTVITFGIYAVVWQNKLFAIKTEQSYFGTARLRYTGKNDEVFMIFLKALPLMILTLGIYSVWFKAKIARYRMAHVWVGSKEIGALRGHLDMSGGQYFGLIVLNLFAIAFTAGLALPWVMAHNVSFFMSRTQFIGKMDFEAVIQKASDGSAVGDGLADALDVGGII